MRQTLALCCVDANRVPRDVFAAHVALAEERARACRGRPRRSSRQRAPSSRGRCARGWFAELVRDVKAPTLVVQGDADRLVPLAASRALAAEPARLAARGAGGHRPRPAARGAGPLRRAGRRVARRACARRRARSETEHEPREAVLQHRRQHHVGQRHELRVVADEIARARPARGERAHDDRRDRRGIPHEHLRPALLSSERR